MAVPTAKPGEVELVSTPYGTMELLVMRKDGDSLFSAVVQQLHKGLPYPSSEHNSASDSLRRNLARYLKDHSGEYERDILVTISTLNSKEYCDLKNDEEKISKFIEDLSKQQKNVMGGIESLRGLANVTNSKIVVYQCIDPYMNVYEPNEEIAQTLKLFRTKNHYSSIKQIRERPGKILYTNVNTLRDKKGKTDRREMMLEMLQNENPFAAIFTEHHLQAVNFKSDRSYEYGLYKPVSYFCRDENYGGVVIYLKDGYDFVKLEDINKKSVQDLFEITGIKVKPKTYSLEINIIGIYRRPSNEMNRKKNKVKFFIKLLEILRMIDRNNYTLIAADFNINHKKGDKFKKYLLQIMKSFGLLQSIHNKATFTSGSCIENIYTDIPKNLFYSHVDPKKAKETVGRGRRTFHYPLTMYFSYGICACCKTMESKDDTAIKCLECKKWMHESCAEISHQKEDLIFVCVRCAYELRNRSQAFDYFKSLSLED